MSCGNKIKNTCGETIYATCVDYELPLPEISNIEDPCVSIEDTTDDLYEITTDQAGQIDLSELGEQCLTYVEDDEGRIVVKNVLLKYEEEICTLKDQVENLQTQDICNVDITGCVDVSGLVDQCDEPIETLGQLLQFLTDQHTTP